MARPRFRRISLPRADEKNEQASCCCQTACRLGQFSSRKREFCKPKKKLLWNEAEDTGNDPTSVCRGCLMQAPPPPSPVSCIHLASNSETYCVIVRFILCVCVRRRKFNFVETSFRVQLIREMFNIGRWTLTQRTPCGVGTQSLCVFWGQ